MSENANLMVILVILVILVMSDRKIYINPNYEL